MQGVGQNTFCRKCGGSIKAGSVFCPNCGQKVIVKKPKKPLVAALLAVTALVLVISAAALAVKLLDKPYTRTVMVYMIGSDLEPAQSSASLDINEMKDANFDQEDTKVVIYTGGSKSWALDNIDPDKNSIFEIKDGENVKVKDYAKKSMTQPETLTEFIDFAYENYQSNYYDLILWDHGGGPIYGYGRDENTISKTPLSMKGLTEAISSSKLAKQQKLEIIGFDACLMGSIEVAKFLEPLADYMVASEETEPGYGWGYNFLSHTNRGVDSATVAKHIVDSFMEQYKNDDYDVSLAAVDLRRLGPVVESVEKLFSKIDEKVTAQTFSEYSLVLSRDKVYGYNGRNDSSPDLVDLKDLSDSVLEEYPDDVKEVGEKISQAVLYSRSNIEYTNGLSVYFPTNNKKNVSEIVAKYKDVSFSGKYYDFLKRYSSFISGEPMVKSSDFKEVAVKASNDGAVSATLPDELANNYQSAEILIFRKIGDDKFLPVFRSSDVKKDKNTIKATSTHLQFVSEITTAKGKKEYGWIVAYEKERTKEYTDYVTFGLAGYESKNNILGWEPKSYEMHIRLPAGKKKANIRSVRTTPGEDNLHSKENLDMKKIQFLEFVVPAFTENIESTGVMYGSSVSFEKKEKVTFKLVDLDFDFGNMYEGEISKDSLKDYYARFIIHDTQGKSHKLNMLHID